MGISVKRSVILLCVFSLLVTLFVCPVFAASDDSESFVPTLTNKMTEEISGKWSQTSYSRAALASLLFLDALGEYRLDVDDYSNGLLTSYVIKETYSGYDFYEVIVRGEKDIILIGYIPDLEIATFSSTDRVSEYVMEAGIASTYDLYWQNDEDDIMGVIHALSEANG